MHEVVLSLTMGVHEKQNFLFFTYGNFIQNSPSTILFEPTRERTEINFLYGLESLPRRAVRHAI